MNKKQTIIILATSILLLLMLLFSILQRVVRDRQTPLSSPAPANTPAPTVEIIQNAIAQPIYQETEEYTRAQQKADLEMIPTLVFMEKEGDFRDSVPYNGRYFSIWYDVYQLKYIVQYAEIDEARAMSELEQFLQEHGLGSIEDLREYKIQIPRE